MTEQAKELVLGIDGGGTKTEWALYRCRDGEATLLRDGRLPASNVKLVTEDSLIQILLRTPPVAGHVGVFLAGCGTPKEQKRLGQIVREIWPEAKVKVGSDRDSAYATAFRDGDGIAVIAGTGSAVHGRYAGRLEKVGGWGQLLGDRGSGYDLGMRGLRSCLRIHDLEGRTTELAREVLRELRLNNLSELVNWAKDADKLAVAKLAPVVFTMAESGDRAVAELVRQGAGRLAEYVRVLAHRLEFPRPTVRLMGGLFAHYPAYVATFEEELRPMVPGAVVEVCRESAASGAAWLVSPGHCRIAAAGEEPEPQSRSSELSVASTEQENPRSVYLDRLPVPELVDLFIAEEDYVSQALEKCRDRIVAAVTVVTAALKTGGHLYYAGAGTSGRLGVLDASEIPPTFGASPELIQGVIAGGRDALYSAAEGAEDRPADGALAMTSREVGPADVVCGIAASGRTPFVLGALEEARRLGAATVFLTCNPARQHTVPAWDVEIDLPTGPELLAGSTRLKAGTATKIVLNILSTCAMIGLGKVRGNLMIDVNASNEKLRDRAARMVSRMLDISYTEACDRLTRHRWQVRACVEEAEVGSITQALAQIGTVRDT